MSLSIIIFGFLWAGNPFLEAHEVAEFDVVTNLKDILAIDNVDKKNGSTIVKV